MVKPWTLLVVAVLSLAVAAAAIESPEYEVVHRESEFEVRLYSKSVWMPAPVTDNINSFHLATKLSFHRTVREDVGYLVCDVKRRVRALWDVQVAEMMAALMGVQVGLDRGDTNINLESDAVHVV